MSKTEELLEIEFAKVAGLSVKEHKNVLGDKQKYINAALNHSIMGFREIKEGLEKLIGDGIYDIYEEWQEFWQKYLGGK